MKNQNKYQSQNHLPHKSIFVFLYFVIKHIASRISFLLKAIVYSFKFILLTTVLLLALNSSAQNSITLQMCHNSSDSLFPLANQKALLSSINTLEIENLRSGYFPQIDLNIKASYQSKVTEIPSMSPAAGAETPTVPHEQYGASVDIKQIIYDGGTIKNAKSLKNLKLTADIQEVKVEQFKIKEQINQFYILCLLIQENEKIISLTKESINEQKKVLKSSVDNGLVNASELDNLTAELLKLDQQEIELASHKKQVLSALNKLSCLSISENDKLELPNLKTPDELKVFRPEHQLFLDKVQLIDANIDMKSTERMPKVYAFTTAGAGYPGLNMFSESMEPYYIIGAQLNWKIWDWKQNKRSKEQLSIQKQVLYNQQEVFDKNINIQLSEARLNAEKLEQLIQKDHEIIALREKISKRSASQLENGSLTSASYLMDLNAEKQAKISLKQREIQLTQAKIELLTISGSKLFDN